MEFRNFSEFPVSVAQDSSAQSCIEKRDPGSGSPVPAAQPCEVRYSESEPGKVNPELMP